ncbi:ribonuclease D [Thermodesulfobacteriota bacterium]
MSQGHPKFILINNSSDLSKIVPDLEKEKAIAVDLEADSMFHYYEKVCLLQISTPDKNILIDPLSIPSLSPLSDVFSDPNVLKVFHGADYDIRSLYRDFGFEVNFLFDTHIAAKFLGIKEIGLANLLHEKFKVDIEKKYQKMDWSKRPLPETMLNYAVLDTCYLLPLKWTLKNELIAKDRLFCVEEECKILSRVRPALPNDDRLFLKFKGAKKLDSLSLAILEDILQFRKKIAIEKDRPPFKIIGNRSILEIIENKPSSVAELKKISGLGPKILNSVGSDILNRIDRVMALPNKDHPVMPPKIKNPSSSKVRNRIKIIKGWREQQASEQNIDPSLIFTNAQITSLAIAHPHDPDQFDDIPEIRKWQKRLFGKNVCSILKSID